jgi:hypothetical protein
LLTVEDALSMERLPEDYARGAKVAFCLFYPESRLAFTGAP